MKKILTIGPFVALLAFSSCNKTKYGNLVFWQESGSGYGTTVVNIDGVSSNITSEYAAKPVCGQSGCAIFNQLETGTYNYSASDGTTTWEGSVVVTEGCTAFQLY